MVNTAGAGTGYAILAISRLVGRTLAPRPRLE
jgi:hypothetical protein